MTQGQLDKAIRRSHELQFAGMDYQKAAYEVLQDVQGPVSDFELQQVESSPEEGCACGFCERAEWKD